MIDKSTCPEHRQPLIDFLSCLLEQDVKVLFNIVDICSKELILESQVEHSVWDEFRTTLFIAAKAQDILNGKNNCN